jgi:hypothetical protein
MQKMPMPKVSAQGSITDKMKKQQMPNRQMPNQVPKRPAPGRLGPKPLNGGKKLGPGGMLDQLKNRQLPRRGPGGSIGKPKPKAPGGMLNKRNEKLKKAYGSSMNSQKASPNYQNMQKAGPAAIPRNIQKGNRPTLRDRNKQAPNFKGVYQGLAKPRPRKTVPSRRGGR